MFLLMLKNSLFITWIFKCWGKWPECCRWLHVLRAANVGCRLLLSSWVLHGENIQAKLKFTKNQKGQIKKNLNHLSQNKPPNPLLELAWEIKPIYLLYYYKKRCWLGKIRKIFFFLNICILPAFIFNREQFVSWCSFIFFCHHEIKQNGVHWHRHLCPAAENRLILPLINWLRSRKETHYKFVAHIMHTWAQDIIRYFLLFTK